VSYLKLGPEKIEIDYLSTSRGTAQLCKSELRSLVKFR
jgi:hypothetical protein